MRLTRRGRSQGWGYGPSGRLGLVRLILVILPLLGGFKGRDLAKDYENPKAD